MFKIQLLKGNETAVLNAVEDSGVLTVNLDKQQIRLHDGSTAGGHPVTYDVDISELIEAVGSLDIQDISGLDVALGLKAVRDQINQPNGILGLGPDAKVEPAQLPSFVDDVEDYADLDSFPVIGLKGKIYVSIETKAMYRWVEDAYVVISADPNTTDEMIEGATRLFYKDSLARESLDSSGDITYDSTSGIFSFEESINSVNGEEGAVVLDSASVGLGYLSDLEVSDKETSESGTDANKMMTPLGARQFMEGMGLEQTLGAWGFDSGRFIDVYDYLTTSEVEYNWDPVKSGNFGSKVELSEDKNTLLIAYRSGAYIYRRAGEIFVYDDVVRPSETGPGIIYREDNDSVTFVSINRPITYNKIDGVWVRYNLPSAPLDKEAYFRMTSSEVSKDKQILICASEGEHGNNLGKAGAAYVYKWDGDQYVYLHRLLEPTPKGDSYFGSSVAVSDDGKIVAIAAKKSFHFGYREGAVHIFESDDLENWIYKQTVNINDGVDAVIDGLVGANSIGLSGDGNTLVFSAHEYVFSGSAKKGLTSVFSRVNGSYEFLTNLTPGGDAVAYDQFIGYHTGISNNGKVIFSTRTDRPLDNREQYIVDTYVQEDGVWVLNKTLVPYELSTNTSYWEGAEPLDIIISDDGKQIFYTTAHKQFTPDNSGRVFLME